MFLCLLIKNRAQLMGEKTKDRLKYKSEYVKLESKSIFKQHFTSKKIHFKLLIIGLSLRERGCLIYKNIGKKISGKFSFKCASSTS